MAHLLIAGSTMSGKTTLTGAMVGKLKEKAPDRPVIVLDPMFNPRLKALADYATDDPERFMKVVKLNRSGILIIDEGGTTIGRYNRTMEVLATQYRHLGHQSFFIVQRPMMIPLTIRINTMGAAVFALGAEDAKELAREYNCPEIRQAPGFARGQYIFKIRFQPHFYGNAFAGSARPRIRGR